MQRTIIRMDVAKYLSRIELTGPVRPDLDTLRRLHRQHLAEIPYENLDVQLGRTVGFDLEQIYRKLVLDRRGGWCFEMNGLLGWALETIGFSVMRLAGAVVRDQLGDAAVGRHLVLAVQLDQPYLVDVGFGDGLIEPIPIVEGRYRQDAFEFHLERLDESWWRFHNHPHGGAPTFDFETIEASPERLAYQCHWLQTSPESPFVQNAVCQRYKNDQLAVLRGRTLRLVRGLHVEKRTIESLTEFHRTLVEIFEIELTNVETVWQKVLVRHEEWLRAQPPA